ncbi:MAG: gamma-glutamyltransferase, partial [Phycisphaerae bacterium]|nr:gamma-glutamyltransferase [Phycisphaerae bacterium]
AGAEILRRGGNAVDAAVATSFTLSVVRPMSCGIGGGGFMIIKFRKDPVHGELATAINYRETCPAAIGADYYEAQADAEASSVGGKAVAVPGTVAGLLYALEKYGTLDRATVLAPAIRAAEEGYLVDRFDVASARNRVRWFDADPSRKQRFGFLWKRFLREGHLQVGDRVRLPEQARALRLIAAQGADAFYRGAIAAAVLDTVRRDGGEMTPQDLSGYRPQEVEPLTYRAMGRQFIAMPPPSSGGIAMAQILRMFETVRESGGVVSSIDSHLLTECMKHAFADRARWLADPQFATVPTAGLISPAYIQSLAARFRPDRTLALEEYGAFSPPPDDGGTSHLCVIDTHGNAVACTETINLSFGSKLAVEQFGFFLNNQMDDFTTRQGTANQFGLMQSERNLPAAGKRPLSSMSPTIVVEPDGQVCLIAGASGGPRIITGTVQAVLKVLVEDASALKAVSAARIHHQWQPDLLEYEPGALHRSELSRLQRKGHKTAPAKEDVGNVQLIRRSADGNGWEAACDPRKGGHPAGF